MDVAELTGRDGVHKGEGWWCLLYRRGKAQVT